MRSFFVSSLVFIYCVTTAFEVPFSFAQSVVPTDSVKLSQDLSEIQVPEELGRVESFYRGAQDKVVVLIQDAHSIPEAQQSIQKLIHFFQTNYQINLVGLEGSSSTHDPQFFKSFPDQAFLRDQFESYFEAGELTGGNAAAIFNESESFYHGIEDWELYEEGVQHFLEAIQKESVLLSELETMRRELSRKKKRVYPEELLKVDQILRDFQENRLGFTEVLKQLSYYRVPSQGSQIELLLSEIKPNKNSSFDSELRSVAKQVKKHLKLATEEDQIRFNQKFQNFQTSKISPKAFSLFLKELSRKYEINVSTSKNFEINVNQQKKIRDIQGTELFERFENYVHQVKESLFESEQQRELDRVSQELDLWEKLSRLELTYKDWKVMRGIDRSLSERASPSAGNGGWGMVSQLASTLQSPIPNPQLFSAHLKFYEIAEKRDKAFYQNTLALMDQNKTQSAIVVAGGFHTEGLTKQLKANGLSYLLLTPQINQFPEVNHYKERMQGKVSWKDYFKIEKGKVNLRDAFMRAARDKLLGGRDLGVGDGKSKDYSPLSSPYTLKHWRDQIIRDLANQNRITEASQYTRFLDEVVQAEKNQELSELRKTWLSNIERFGAGLLKLESQQKLNEANITNLIKTITNAEMVLSNILTSEVVAPRYLPAIFQSQNNLVVSPFQSSETRSLDSPEKIKQEINQIVYQRNYLFREKPDGYKDELFQLQLKINRLLDQVDVPVVGVGDLLGGIKALESILSQIKEEDVVVYTGNEEAEDKDSFDVFDRLNKEQEKTRERNKGHILRLVGGEEITLLRGFLGEDPESLRRKAKLSRNDIRSFKFFGLKESENVEENKSFKNLLRPILAGINFFLNLLIRIFVSIFPSSSSEQTKEIRSYDAVLPKLLENIITGERLAAVVVQDRIFTPAGINDELGAQLEFEILRAKGVDPREMSDKEMAEQVSNIEIAEYINVLFQAAFRQAQEYHLQGKPVAPAFEHALFNGRGIFWNRNIGENSKTSKRQQAFGRLQRSKITGVGEGGRLIFMRVYLQGQKAEYLQITKQGFAIAHKTVEGNLKKWLEEARSVGERASKELGSASEEIQKGWVSVFRERPPPFELEPEKVPSVREKEFGWMKNQLAFANRDANKEIFSRAMIPVLAARLTNAFNKGLKLWRIGEPDIYLKVPFGYDGSEQLKNTEFFSWSDVLSLPRVGPIVSDSEEETKAIHKIFSDWKETYRPSKNDPRSETRRKKERFRLIGENEEKREYTYVADAIGSSSITVERFLQDVFRNLGLSLEEVETDPGFELEVNGENRAELKESYLASSYKEVLLKPYSIIKLNLPLTDSESQSDVQQEKRSLKRQARSQIHPSPKVLTSWTDDIDQSGNWKELENDFYFFAGQPEAYRAEGEGGVMDEQKQDLYIKNPFYFTKILEDLDIHLFVEKDVLRIWSQTPDREQIKDSFSAVLVHLEALFGLLAEHGFWEEDAKTVYLGDLVLTKREVELEDGSSSFVLDIRLVKEIRNQNFLQIYQGDIFDYYERENIKRKRTYLNKPNILISIALSLVVFISTVIIYFGSSKEEALSPAHLPKKPAFSKTIPKENLKKKVIEAPEKTEEPDSMLDFEKDKFLEPLKPFKSKLTRRDRWFLFHIKYDIERESKDPEGASKRIADILEKYSEVNQEGDLILIISVAELSELIDELLEKEGGVEIKLLNHLLSNEELSDEELSDDALPSKDDEVFAIKRIMANMADFHLKNKIKRERFLFVGIYRGMLSRSLEVFVRRMLMQENDYEFFAMQKYLVTLLDRWQSRVKGAYLVRLILFREILFNQKEIYKDPKVLRWFESISEKGLRSFSEMIFDEFYFNIDIGRDTGLKLKEVTDSFFQNFLMRKEFSVVREEAILFLNRNTNPKHPHFDNLRKFIVAMFKSKEADPDEIKDLLSAMSTFQGYFSTGAWEEEQILNWKIRILKDLEDSPEATRFSLLLVSELLDFFELNLERKSEEDKYKFSDVIDPEFVRELLNKTTANEEIPVALREQAQKLRLKFEKALNSGLNESVEEIRERYKASFKSLEEEIKKGKRITIEKLLEIKRVVDSLQDSENKVKDDLLSLETLRFYLHMSEVSREVRRDLVGQIQSFLKSRQKNLTEKDWQPVVISLLRLYAKDIQNVEVNQNHQVDYAALYVTVLKEEILQKERLNESESVIPVVLLVSQMNDRIGVRLLSYVELLSEQKLLTQKEKGEYQALLQEKGEDYTRQVREAAKSLRLKLDEQRSQSPSRSETRLAQTSHEKRMVAMDVLENLLSPDFNQEQALDGLKRLGANETQLKLAIQNDSNNPQNKKGMFDYYLGKLLENDPDFIKSDMNELLKQMRSGYGNINQWSIFSILSTLVVSLMDEERIKNDDRFEKLRQRQAFESFQRLEKIVGGWQEKLDSSDSFYGISSTMLVFRTAMSVVFKDEAVNAFIRVHQNMLNLPEEYRFQAIALNFIFLGNHFFDEFYLSADKDDLEGIAEHFEPVLKILEEGPISDIDRRWLEVGLVRFLTALPYIFETKEADDIRSFQRIKSVLTRRKTQVLKIYDKISALEDEHQFSLSQISWEFFSQTISSKAVQIAASKGSVLDQALLNPFTELHKKHLEIFGRNLRKKGAVEFEANSFRHFGAIKRTRKLARSYIENLADIEEDQPARGRESTAVLKTQAQSETRLAETPHEKRRVAMQVLAKLFELGSGFEEKFLKQIADGLVQLGVNQKEIEEALEQVRKFSNHEQLFILLSKMIESDQDLIKPDTRVLLAQSQQGYGVQEDNPFSILSMLVVSLMDEDPIREDPEEEQVRQKQALKSFQQLEKVIEQWQETLESSNMFRGIASSMLVFRTAMSVFFKGEAKDAFVRIHQNMQNLPKKYRNQAIALNLVFLGNHFSRAFSPEADEADFEGFMEHVEYILNSLQQKNTSNSDKSMLKIGFARFLMQINILERGKNRTQPFFKDLNDILQKNKKQVLDIFDEVSELEDKHQFSLAQISWSFFREAVLNLTLKSTSSNSLKLDQAFLNPFKPEHKEYLKIFGKYLQRFDSGSAHVSFKPFESIQEQRQLARSYIQNLSEAKSETRWIQEDFRRGASAVMGMDQEVRQGLGLKEVSTEEAGKIYERLLQEMKVEALIERLRVTVVDITTPSLAFAASVDDFVSDETLGIVSVNQKYFDEGLAQAWSILSATYSDQKIPFGVQLETESGIENLDVDLTRVLREESSRGRPYLGASPSREGKRLVSELHSLLKSESLESVHDPKFEKAQLESSLAEKSMGVITLGHSSVSLKLPGLTLITYIEEGVSYHSLTSLEKESLIKAMITLAKLKWLGLSLAEFLKNQPELLRYFPLESRGENVTVFSLSRFRNKMRTLRAFATAA